MSILSFSHWLLGSVNCSLIFFILSARSFSSFSRERREGACRENEKDQRTIHRSQEPVGERQNGHSKPGDAGKDERTGSCRRRKHSSNSWKFGSSAGSCCH